MHFAADPDGVLRDAVADGSVAGIAACAATRRGSVYAAAFGTRRLGDGAPMTCDSMGWIASMTKPITTIAALQLVERGALTLDEPVAPFIPALRDVHVLCGFDDDGTPRTRPAMRPITLRMLLTHTAGFGYEMWSEPLLRYARFVSPAAPPARLATLEFPLLNEPGDGFTYGTSIDWAGRIVEAIAGCDIATYVRENVCDPLGMRDTVYALDAGQRARMCAMHARTPDGELRVSRFEIPPVPAALLGGSGMFGSAADYLALVRALLAGGELDGARILQANTVDAMFRNQIGDIRIAPMRSVMPAATNDVDFIAGRKWGFGLLLQTADAAGSRRAGSGGWAGLANTYFWIDPVAGAGGVVFAQQLPFADARMLEVCASFERALYAREGWIVP